MTYVVFNCMKINHDFFLRPDEYFTSSCTFFGGGGGEGGELVAVMVMTE